MLDEIWVVVTSDHGEAFGEHGVVRHGTGVYNEETRIPLLIRPPAGQALVASAEAVGLLDVTATLAAIGTGEVLGSGRDLRGAVEPAPVAFELFGFFRRAATSPPDLAVLGARADTPARGVVLGDYKLVDYPGQGEELYDLTVDPHERQELAAEEPETVERLRAWLPPLAGESQ